MFQILKDTNYDFLGKKWLFMGLSWALILVGIGSMVYRAFDGKDYTHPFNLGVDFSGGTLATVKFKSTPDFEKLRELIAAQGIEITKITLQPVGDEIGQAPKHELLVRLPNLLEVQRQTGQAETAARATDDADIGKQKLLAALAGFNEGNNAGKIDLNTRGIDVLREEMAKRAGLDAQRAAEVAQLIVDYREKTGNGLIQNFNDIKGLRDSEGKTIAERLGNSLDANFFAGAAAVKSAEAVSPQVGAELRNRAIWVTIISCIGMLIYVAFRFKSWGFGIGAVIAVFHDVLVTLGIFSLMQWEINLTVIAALLTLVGYSMNDTIVIFDRVRELLRTRRREGLEKLTNDSINQTLSRTIITAGLTFLTVLALLIFGGEVLRSFSWALFIGIIIGAYSTMYIASPFMLWWEAWRAKSRAAATGVAVSGEKVVDGDARTAGASGVTPQMLAAAGISTKRRKKGK
jgi:preprotein translocase subunit SecF